MKFVKDLLPYLIIVIVVVLIRSFVVTPVRVNGTSMAPTLKGNEIMLLNRLAKIERYDIVVVKLDEQDDNMIKRIIGLPGETVEIKNNKVYINDKELDDKFANGVTYNIDKVTLKDNEYFILGDNRIVSLDSRVFGTIKEDEIKGTASFVIYPFKKIGKVK